MTSTRTGSSSSLQDQNDNKNTSSIIIPHLISVPDSNISTKGLIAVLPAFNEELCIGTIVLRTQQYVETVIVVDDGSSDHTSDVARLAGAEVIRLDYNTGKAYALLLGLRHARETGCTAAVMLDTDGQHDPQEIPRVAGLVMAGKADLVIGSRFIEKKNGIPVYRQIGQKTLDIFTNFGAKSKVTDSQSGFRALSSKALDNLDFKSQGYNVESDMINHFSSIGLAIVEVPISVTYEVPNKHKKNPLSHGVGVLTRLINLIGYRRPLLLFGAPGAFLFVAGLIGSSFAFTEYYTTSYFPFILSTVSALLLIMGMLLVIAGLLLNTLLMMMNEHRR